MVSQVAMSDSCIVHKCSLGSHDHTHNTDNETQHGGPCVVYNLHEHHVVATAGSNTDSYSQT